MYESEKIRYIRHELKLTQQEVADKLGVSKQYLSKVENGQTELSIDKMKVFCEAYNVSFEWMYGKNTAEFENDIFCKKLFMYPDKDYLTIFMNAYNLYIIYIKDFIERRFPDANFENKLKTADNMFKKSLEKNEIPLSNSKTKEWLNFALTLESFQKDILNTYYEVCKSNNSKNP